jgi:predicted nucleotidyltransferase/DNA-binding XRE family transcriptional regulator
MTEGIGARVAKARRAQRLSQQRLAELTGLDRTAISKIENGRRRVKSDELGRLARALDRPLEWFLSTPDQRGGGLAALKRRRQAILRLASAHGATSVRVFGSVRRGDDSSGSDIDFLVELEPGRSLLDQAALLVEIRQFLGRDVDVVTPQGLRPRIRDRVLREAEPL